MIWAILALFVASAGAHPTSRSSRIYGGDTVSIEEFPSTASLRYFGNHWCTCVLYDTTHVITSAFCTDGRSGTSFDVHYNSGSRTGNGILTMGSGFRQHPDYDPNNPRGVNDISIVSVVQITFDDVRATPANLPSGSSDFAGASGNILGWGRLVDDDYTIPNSLHMATVPIISNGECTLALSGFAGISIDPAHICVFDGISMAIVTCEGDQGGPLYTSEGGQLVLAGISSWEIGYCDSAYPSVYTRVSDYLDWIQETV